jgi:DNA-binding MarR family transcriptional regulator
MFKAVKKGTQKFRVLEYFNRFPKADNKTAAKDLDLPLPTIRGRKSDLKKEKYIKTKIVKNKTVDITTTEKAKEEFPELTDEEYARDDFIDDIDEDVWYKKILKTGKTSNPLWKTSTNIEAVTFEKLDCDTNRFQDMLNTIVDNIMEISYIDEAGYDCEPIGYDFIDEQAQYPRIKVTMFSAGGSTTKYIP